MEASETISSPLAVPIQITAENGEEESCIATFAREEDFQNAQKAMGMLSVSESGESSNTEQSTGRNHLVGRAGTMSPSSPPPKDLEPYVTLETAVKQDIGWKDFARNYAAGNFDPNRTPQPPVRSIASLSVPSAQSSPGVLYSSLDQPNQQQPTSSDTNSSGASGATSAASLLSGTTQPSSAPSVSPTRSLSSNSASAIKGVAIKAKSLEAETLLPRSQSPQKDRLVLPSYNMAAATMRMASASSGLAANSLAPLGVPSPDKELTDPMAKLVSSASSSRPIKDTSGSDPSHGSRYPLSRSMSSAMDVDRHHMLQLPTIQGSPAASPYVQPRQPRPHHSTNKNITSPSWRRGGVLMANIPPASAPLEKTVEAATQEDYFGDSVSPPPSGGVSRQGSYSSGGSSSQNTVTGPAPTPKSFTDHPDERDETPSPRSLTPPSPSAVLPENMSAMYEKFGWLPAPVPPDEMARRRALYRFNILHTASDINFDRIAHMAKLVFASKIVLIALIDGDLQWHKTQAGPAINSETPRVASFCAHSILAQ